MGRRKLKRAANIQIWGTVEKHHRRRREKRLRNKRVHGLCSSAKNIRQPFEFPQYANYRQTFRGWFFFGGNGEGEKNCWQQCFLFSVTKRFIIMTHICAYCSVCASHLIPPPFFVKVRRSRFELFWALPASIPRKDPGINFIIFMAKSIP